MPSPEESDIFRAQVEAMKKLWNGREWAEYVRFLKTQRKPALQEKANSLLRAGKTAEAQIALALMDDVEKNIAFFGEHIKESEKALKTGAK